MINSSNLAVKAMEADTISKNGQSSKSHNSRGNFSKTWIYRIIVVFFIFAHFSIATSCTQDEIVFQSEEVQILETDWWLPILQKHNLEPVAYNNFENVFAMGKGSNTVNNGICTLKIATVLIKNKENYFFIEADSINYNIEEGVFDIMNGVGKIYKMDSDLSKPSVTVTDLSKLTIASEEGREKYQYNGKAIVFY